MAGTVLVTGARGFLGGRLMEALRARGWPAVGATRAPILPDHVGWEAGGALPLAGVDTVVHAAAHRPRRYDAPEEAERCLAVNAVATAKLLEDAIAAGVRRFVYIGAGNVYRPLGRPAREDDPIWPTHRAPYYLASKICGEFFVAAAANRISAVSLRPSALYGPGMPPGMIPTFLRELSAGRSVSVADGGRHEADLVHVDDVINVLFAWLQRGPQAAPRGGELDVFNVGSGRVTTSLQVAELLCDLLGAPRSRISVELPSAGAPAGFAPLDVSRAVSLLGYAPRALHDGLRTMMGGDGCG